VGRAPRWTGQIQAGRGGRLKKSKKEQRLAKKDARFAVRLQCLGSGMSHLEGVKALIGSVDNNDNEHWVGHDRIKVPPKECVGHQAHLGDNTAEVVDVNFYYSNNKGKQLSERVWDGRFRDVEKLLKEGANPNFVDPRQVENGWSPMHTAIMAGHMHIIRLLICYGARSDVKNEEGQTAVNTAHGTGREDMATLLEDDDEHDRLKEQYQQIKMNEQSGLFTEKKITTAKNELFECECGPDKNSFLTFCEGVTGGSETEMDAGAINELLGKTESVSKEAKERKALLANLNSGKGMR
jgi:hypothetical protein